jgi:hypothetical protein
MAPQRKKGRSKMQLKSSSRREELLSNVVYGIRQRIVPVRFHLQI